MTDARHWRAPAELAGEEESRARLDLALSAAQVGSFDWDLADGTLHWDSRLHELFGTDPGTFGGHIDAFWELVHPADRPAVRQAVERAVSEGGEYVAEYRVRRPDGAVRWVEARGRVVPDPERAPGRMIGVARDSTELRLARGEVARALEHMADAFLAVDDQGVIRFLNRPAERLVRSGPGAVGRALCEEWPRAAVEPCASALETVRTSGRVHLVTVYDTDRDTWWQLRLVPGDEGVGGLSVFGTDITATRAAGQDLSRPEQARLVLAYTTALTEAESLQDVTDAVATMVLPAFGAAGMLVSLVESGRLSLAGHFGYGERAVELLRVIDVDSATPIAEALRNREPLFLPSRGAYLARYPHLRETMEATEKHAWAFLPLIVEGRSLGSLTVSFNRPRDFVPEERSLLVSVSGLVAQTIARARLRDSERSLAAELQAHLLPRALPQPPGMSARAHYLPATDGVGVGGDWYDLLELPGGRVGLVIGDVQGHNMKAAAVMGQLRNALRAYAAEGHEPAAVLSRTNRLMSDLDPSLFATCCYLAVDPLSGRGELVLAGHPAPLCRGVDGVVSPLEGPVGPPLGVAPGEEYRTAHVVLRRGDLVALFTDGLVEDSRRTYEEGIAMLGHRLAEAEPEDLEATVDALVADALSSTTRSDDIALLVVRHDGVAESLQPVHARLDVDRSDPRAARVARDFIATFIAMPELDEVRDTCVLLVSEVVTNALRHTDGQVGLELWRYPDRLRVEVSDATSRGVVPGGGSPLDESGRGVPIMDALSSRWGTAPHGEGKIVWFELDLTD